MEKRNKLYYSESDIVTNQYTNGYFLMEFDTWQNYVGMYHFYKSTGEVYTEPDWDPIKSKKLIKFRPGKNPDYFRYVDLVHYTRIDGKKEELAGPIKLHKFFPPVQYVISPTEVDKKKGIMTRYFLIKRNEVSTRNPIEIDPEQASTYETNGYGVNQHLYHLVELPWKLNGPEYDIYMDGILKSPGVIDTNKRVVMNYSRKFPILAKTITNYRQFSKYDQ